MTGSAIIDLPTIFVLICAALLLWDNARTAILIGAQLVNIAWCAYLHRTR